MAFSKGLGRELAELGVGVGDTVFLYQNRPDLGTLAGRGPEIVQAILAVIGDRGTLVVPAFSNPREVYVPDHSPSISGELSLAVLALPQVRRSIHPTHSIAAVGRLAELITEDHERGHAFARESPLFRLIQAKGKSLIIGTSLSRNPIVHVAEEISQVPYLERSITVPRFLPSGKQGSTRVRVPGCGKGFGKLDEVLAGRGLLARGALEGLPVLVVTARDVLSEAIETLDIDSGSLLCEEPDCESCALARAAIDAMNAEMQDNEILEIAKQEERTRRNLEMRLSGDVRFMETDDSFITPN